MRVRTELAARAAERALATVILQVGEGGDGVGIAVEIPIQQIEMMGRLVDEQTAGIFRIGMPAAEVVGAVLGVQIPVEVDRGDPADFA